MATKKEKDGANSAGNRQFVTQGTVLVRLIKDGKCAVFIHPLPDYAVKHRENNYTVFLNEKEGEAKLVDTKQHIDIEKDDFLLPQLIDAASKGTKIEVAIAYNGSEKTITSITIPAKP